MKLTNKGKHGVAIPIDKKIVDIAMGAEVEVDDKAWTELKESRPAIAAYVENGHIVEGDAAPEVDNSDDLQEAAEAAVEAAAVAKAELDDAAAAVTAAGAKTTDAQKAAVVAAKAALSKAAAEAKAATEAAEKA